MAEPFTPDAAIAAAAKRLLEARRSDPGGSPAPLVRVPLHPAFADPAHPFHDLDPADQASFDRCWGGLGQELQEVDACTGKAAANALLDERCVQLDGAYAEARRRIRRKAAVM